MNKLMQDEVRAELSRFWGAIGDAARMPGGAFERCDPVYKLKTRSVLAHQLVCDAHRALHNAILSNVPVDYRNYDVSGKTIAEFGERYCLSLLGQTFIIGEAVEAAMKIAREQRVAAG